MATAPVRQWKIQRTEPHFAEKHEVHNIAVASITVGKRMRPLGDITALVESIREVGLLNPILITQGRRLISGLHRLAAFKALGRRTIPCIILNVSQQEAQLREIDENLARNDLTVLQRGEHLLRRKELYEALHPETRKGGDRGNQYSGGRKCRKDNMSFCQTAATLTGQSSKTAQRLVRIAKLLTTETKKLLRGTGWADNQRALMKLCNLDTETQEAVAHKVADGESRNISDAIAKTHQERLKSRKRSLPQEGDGDKVQCGDCITLMNKMQAGSVGLIVTSPPYNLRNSTGNGMKDGSGSKWPNARLRNGYETDKNGAFDDEMPHNKYVAWQRKCLALMMRVLREDGAIFYVHKWRVQNGLLQDRSDIVKGFPVRQIIIWQRDGGINFNSGYFLPTYEVIYLICKPDFKLAPCANAIGDVWHIPQEADNVHPAPFPVDLAKLCIQSTSADVVLDPFMGSGTTAVAAEFCNRRWIGFDISQHYCNFANERIQAARRLKGSRPLPEQTVEGPTSIM